MENKLYSYKLKHDNRFAPNPLFGVLTLATCKPGIRRNTQIGNWIAGWTSRYVAHNPTEVGKEKLIYVARVTDRITISEYWEKYPQKRPVSTDDVDILERYGDNIYQPCEMELDGFVQVKNIHHSEKEKRKDLSGKNVLICNEFYYFSCIKPLEIPLEIRPNIPKAQTCYGVITEDASRFIEFVKQHIELCKYANAK